MNSLNSGPMPPVRRRPWPQPSAKTLAFVALALWFASWPLTGLVIYHEQQRVTGTQIVAFGWLALNLAWWANPLFIWSFLRILANKPAVGRTLLAALISLDTFRFSGYPLDVGSATSPVYGYGWGAVLWFVALGMLVAAAGTRQIEARLEAHDLQRVDEWFRPIGLGLCMLLLTSAVALAIHDRLRANSAERERLSGLVSKRGPVCSAAEPSLSHPLRPGSGPVEVKVSRRHDYDRSDPFSDTTALLSWGIPVVRVGGRDYSYVPSGEGKLLMSVPASASVAAVLDVIATEVEGQSQIRAKLVEQPSARMVFDHTWLTEGRSTRFCPDYSDAPKAAEQPRKLLMQALALQSPPEQSDLMAPRVRQSGDPQVQAVILNNAVALGLNERQQPSGSERVADQRQGNGGESGQAKNRHCPDGVGWQATESRQAWGNRHMHRPFMVSDRAYFIEGWGQHHALCVGDHAYLSSGAAGDGKYYLRLEKRRLSDLQPEWSGTVVVDDPNFSRGVHELDVDMVDDGPDSLTIRLIMEQTGQTALIRAPHLRPR